MFLYERFYEIWIMQFVLSLRLKPDLCKSSDKLSKDFVRSSIRHVFISKVIFCLYYIRYACMALPIFHLSRTSFLRFLHFREKDLLVETLRQLGRVIQWIILIFVTSFE